MSKKDEDPRKEVFQFLRKAQTTKAPLFVGVDPGASGAIAFVCGTFHLAVDIPTIKVNRGKKNKTGFMYSTIAEMFEMVKDQLPRKVKFGKLHAIIEEGTVGIPGKGNSAYNGFRVGCNYGMWPLFLVSQGFTLEEVKPTQWKKAMGLAKKDKETSRFMAMRMFPKASLARKKDHDRAEALLLAEYLRRKQRGA